eukprot:gene17863-32264_t
MHFAWKRALDTLSVQDKLYFDTRRTLFVRTGQTATPADPKDTAAPPSTPQTKPAKKSAKAPGKKPAAAPSRDTIDDAAPTASKRKLHRTRSRIANDELSSTKIIATPDGLSITGGGKPEAQAPLAKRIKQSNDFAETDFAALVALGLEPVIAALRIGKTSSFSAEQLKQIFAAITLPNLLQSEHMEMFERILDGSEYPCNYPIFQGTMSRQDYLKRATNWLRNNFYSPLDAATMRMKQKSNLRCDAGHLIDPNAHVTKRGTKANKSMVYSCRHKDCSSSAIFFLLLRTQEYVDSLSVTELNLDSEELDLDSQTQTQPASPAGSLTHYVDETDQEDSGED